MNVQERQQPLVAFVHARNFLSSQDIIQLLHSEALELNDSARDKCRGVTVCFHTDDIIENIGGSVLTKLHLDVSLNPLQYFSSTLSTLEMEAYGINVNQAIVVSVTICISSTSGTYVLPLRGDSDVTVTSYQTTALNGYHFEDNQQQGRYFFPLSHLIEKRIRSSLLGKYLPTFFEGTSNSNCIQALIDIVSEVIHEAPCYCIVSGRKHLDDGFRPGAIDAEPVIRSAIDFGFGGKLLKWYITNDPALLDITLSSALATIDRSWSYPHFVITPQIPPEYSPDMINGKTPWLEYDTTKEIIKMIPSVKMMQQMVSNNTLEEELNKRSKYCYPFLQWLVLTNRIHLKDLTHTLPNPPQNVHLYGFMSTQFQTEKKFQEGSKKQTAYGYLPLTVCLSHLAKMRHKLAPSQNGRLESSTYLTPKCAKLWTSNVAASSWQSSSISEAVFILSSQYFVSSSNDRDHVVYRKEEVQPRCLLVGPRNTLKNTAFPDSVMCQNPYEPLL